MMTRQSFLKTIASVLAAPFVAIGVVKASPRAEKSPVPTLPPSTDKSRDALVHDALDKSLSLMRLQAAYDVRRGLTPPDPVDQLLDLLRPNGAHGDWGLPIALMALKSVRHKLGEYYSSDEYKQAVRTLNDEARTHKVSDAQVEWYKTHDLNS